MSINFKDFPIYIGTLDKIEKYSKLLVRGEKVLLIDSDTLEDMYISKGDGTYKGFVSSKTNNATKDAIDNIMSELKKIYQKIDGFNSIKQMNLQNITSPYVVEIKDFDTIDFKVGKINVLKHETLNKDTLVTLCDFNIDDECYVKDERLLFENGKVKINKTYFTTYSPTDEEGEYAATLDLDYFDNITDLEDLGDKIKITNVPKNVELRQQTDFTISDNAGHIKDIKITGQGDIKVIFSFDCGKTWHTVKDRTIEEISYLEINEKGMTLEEFNNLNVDYDFLLENKKIRFNYSLNNSNEIDAEIDNIKMLYDGIGVWKEYKNYDLTYSNKKSFLELKDNGTYKINY